ncbi:hypothetical protein [Halosegnis longus]|uniref:hypothetical protein n=1 Tax=Halosegnis longus TaxID=2216012 RepID=UPI00129E3D76|nr:hypothetical protein [Halosegnis longus]
MFDWEPTIWAVTVYLNIVLLSMLIRDYIKASDLSRARLTRAIGVLRGDEPERQSGPPTWDMQQFNQTVVYRDELGLTATALAGSPETCRWYALEQLRSELNESDRYQYQGHAGDEAHRIIRQEAFRARDDAVESIMRRVELTRWNDSSGIADRYLLEDPVTQYRLKVAASNRILDTDGPTAQKVQERNAERLASQLLEQIADEADGIQHR